MAKSRVTVKTQQAPKFPGRVIVVNSEKAAFDTTGISRSANSTPTVLLLEHLIVFIKRDVIRSFQVALPMVAGMLGFPDRLVLSDAAIAPAVQTVRSSRVSSKIVRGDIFPALTAPF
jgi:hypothetical protein